MFVWNRNERLCNGTAGLFVRKDGKDKIIVHFPDVGQVGLKKEIWNKVGPSGQVLGTRTQFPVILMYATTCHKAQGLTLPSLFLHSSKEFVPGLVYVALSRVRSANHLQVINFHLRQLLLPQQSCLTVCENAIPPIESLECCRKTELTEIEQRITDAVLDDGTQENDEDVILDGVEQNLEGVIKSYFERGEPDELYLDLETVNAVLIDDNASTFLRVPPESFSVQNLLINMKVAKPLTPFAGSKNETLDWLINQNMTNVCLLGNIMWSRACKLILEKTIINISDIHISSKEWSLDTSTLHTLITKSPSYWSDLQKLFQTKELNDIQTTIASHLMVDVYKNVVHQIANKVREEVTMSPIAFSVYDMPDAALSKVRYVGAWSIAKVFYKNWQYVKNFKGSRSVCT